MAAADALITIKEILTLSSIGIKQEFITSTNVTMESEKYICVRETSPQNSVVIIDMSMPMKPFRRPTTADSALVNPNSKILALKASLPGTTQDHLQVFNIETKVKMKSCQMREHVSFWKWITPKLLGLVTEASVYHWSIEGDSEPVKMFNRTSNLANNQIIDYRCDISQKWLVLIGTAPGSPERPQLIKGNMQLFSVDQQLSQALEAHTASFASFKVSGNENPSTLISFATTKVTSAGQITSKLHVVELGAQSGRAAFTRKQLDLFTPPDLVDDFPVAIQISNRYSLIHVITKLGLLYVNDLKTATAVYRNWISLDPVILTSEASYDGGFYAINRIGQVLLATINESSIVSFIISQLNNLELAVDVAKRGNLPGAENLVVQRFQKLFAQSRYKEAAELAAESPQGILRTPDTIAKFQSVPVQGGQTPPILQYFGTLLTKGKLNAFESLELSQLVIYRNKNLLKNWLAEDKLECTEELGDLVNTLDNDLAVKIYIKASATSKVVQRFQELFAQTKYEEAAELAAESPEGILRTPETVAKFKCIPLQGRETPLLQYFITLLSKVKLNAFESIELSRLVVIQNQKNVLENYIAEDKLECTEELGDIVKTVDNDLALKIYVKAGAFSKCFQELFAQTKYKEAAELAVKYQGILRNSDTVAKFQSVPVQDGQTPPLLQYFGTLLTKGKLNAFESLELSRLVVYQIERNLLDNWLADDKLECTEELKELVKVIQYFHVLFAQTKYKEAAKLAIEYQGVLRTPDTVAKFQSVPVQAGQTPPLLRYFETLLIKGKLNAFESIELSRLVVNQNKKNLLENWLAKDKLECSEELGDIVRTLDNDLALKIYMKAEATSKVVKALSERREFDKLLIYSKQVGYTPPDFLFLLQTILRSDFQGAVKFALIMFRMEGGCPVDYNTITDLFLQKNLIREATTFLLEVLKPDLAEHAFLQTKVLEINIFTFPNVVDAILAKEIFSHYDRPRISQLCEEAGLYVKLFWLWTHDEIIKLR